MKRSTLMRIARPLLLGGSATLLCYAGTAHAAGDGLPSDANVGAQLDAATQRSRPVGLQLEEVTVTARKREETLLDVPISITAISAAEIEKRGIRDLEDLSRFTPGFYFTNLTNSRSDRSTTNLRFRGMATSGVNSPDADLATLFVDSIPVAGGAQPPIQDVERVEVIKGPQSAYFGRATFAGAVNYITRNPGNDWKAGVKAEVGSYGLSDDSVSLEGPLIASRLAFRLFARDYKTDGDYINAADSSERIGAQSTKSVGLTLYATPTSDLRVKARAQYWRDEDGPSPAIQYGIGQTTCQKSATLQPYFCGQLPKPPGQLIGYDTSFTPLTRQQLLGNAANFSLPFKPGDLVSGFGYGRRAYQASVAVDYDLPGGTSFSAYAAYNHDDNISFDGAGRDSANFPDNPFGSFPTKQVWQYFGEETYRDTSAEARLLSDASQRLRWLVGFSYLQSFNRNGNGFFSPFGYVQFPDSLPVTIRAKTSGVFGSLAYDILSNVTLSLEGRYQQDKIKQQATGGPPLSANYNSFLPRVILNYKPIPSWNLYAQYSQGNRPGFFNATISTLTPQQAAIVQMQTGATLAEPESTLKDYEMGLKAELWDKRVQFSGDIYYMQWGNQRAAEIATLQTNLPPPATPIINVQVQTAVGSTDLKGIELEGVVQLTELSRLSLTFDDADSSIKTFDCAGCVPIIGTNNVNGHKTPRVPQYTVSAAYDFEHPFVSPDTSWFAEGEYLYSGRKYESELNLAWVGASNVFNFRLGLRGEHWTAEGYVKNAFNDRTQLNVQKYVDLYNVVGGTSALAIALPQLRTFGARFSYQFF